MLYKTANDFPSSLSLEDWQTDWEVFKQELKEYESIN